MLIPSLAYGKHARVLIVQSQVHKRLSHLVLVTHHDGSVRHGSHCAKYVSGTACSAISLLYHTLYHATVTTAAHVVVNVTRITIMPAAKRNIVVVHLVNLVILTLAYQTTLIALPQRIPIQGVHHIPESPNRIVAKSPLYFSHIIPSLSFQLVDALTLTLWVEEGCQTRIVPAHIFKLLIPGILHVLLSYGSGIFL